MNSFETIKALIPSMEADYSKFQDTKNKAAGTRLRKALMELKTRAHEMRKEIQDIKNQEDSNNS